MPAGNKNVLPSVIVDIGDRRRIATHGLAEQGHAAFLRHVNEISLPRIAIEGKRLLVESYHANIGKAVTIEVTKVSAHPRDVYAVSSQQDVDIGGDFVEFPATLVSEERIVHLIVGDEEAHSAAMVEIGRGRTHSLPRMRTEP